MKENNNTKNVLYFALVLLCIISITTIFTVMTSCLKGSAFVTNEIETYRYYNNNKNDDVTYLSDIDYISKQSFTKWDKIRYNEINGGGKITVKIENNAFTFDKGIWAHATSQVTYDISEYNYKYFTTFIGINTSSNAGNGVKYTIYTSQDGSKWDAKIENVLKKPGENATFVKVDIQGAKYLRLIANDNGANGNDHSVYADAKLVNDVDESSAFPSVEEYNNIIKSKYANQKDITGEFEFTLLKRELIKKVGQFTLNSFYNASAENKATIDWLMSNQDVLRYYILGGTPAGGSYYNSLTQLSRLYNEYASDFNNTELLNNKWEPTLTYGDLYKKMAITLSLTHSQTVGLWMQSGRVENQSDALRRYAIYKYLHKEGRLRASSSIDITPLFESLKIEEMRFVMNNSIDDEEMIWLNSYVKTKIAEEPKKAWLTPHPHMAYVWPNYGNPVYYDDANYDYFNELFSVMEPTMSENKIGLFDVEYTIPGGKNIPSYKIKITRGTTNNKINKVWMNFRNKFGTGAVCGGISKSGSNIRTTHGIPATVIGQPGHAALLFYSKDAQGRGYWGIDNDVSGWSQSEKGERMLLGWGNASYSKGYSVVYMVLAQEALNNYDNLVKAEEQLMLARVYSNDEKKQETLIRRALDIQNINIDAWYDLITLYNNSNNKSEDDYYKLAEEIAENLKYFPLPMYHLTNLIKPKLTSIQNSYKFTLLQERTLKEASATPNNTAEHYYVYQPSVTRTEANYLLKKVDTTIATFSFDGEDAGKIVLSSRFDGNGVRWDYSLDGKKTWTEVSFTAEEPHKLQLTKEQIAKITAENDIYVHIVGVNYNEENLYKIDITEGTLPKYNGGDYLYGNDLENRVVGVDLTMEWRYSEKDTWTSYAKSSPELTGNKTVQVRVGATGTKLPSESVTFKFTEDKQDNNRKYIPVSHLTLSSVSTQATSHAGNATNSLDANYNTRWHSDWNGKDTNRFIIVKIDKPVYLSAVEFVPAGGGNGKIYDGTIYGSMDGENWQVLSKETNLTYTNQANSIADAITNTKTFEVKQPIEVQYVKIVADRTNGNWFTARAFNFYQDLTKNPHPTAGIGYSTTNPTNQEVVARLVNPSTKIKITNNGGKDTYTFTKNGKFTFEFIDEETGLTGSAEARVDWIDKVAPTATIEYSTKKSTNQEVVAKLVPSEKVTIINNEIADTNNSNADPNANLYTITFDENGSYTFEFKDAAGNVGKATATVDWIDKKSPTAKVSYNTTSTTGEAVVATLSDYSEDIIVTNNGGKNIYIFNENGEFTFEFRDAAGNTGKATAKVTWIDKKVPTAKIKYSITTQTSNNVVATLTDYSEDITIINNGGKNEYTFYNNGSFEFKFKNKAGVIGTAIARVDWIVKDNQDNNKPSDTNQSSNNNKPDDNNQPNNGNQTAEGNQAGNNNSTNNGNQTDNNNQASNNKPTNNSTSNKNDNISKPADKNDGVITRPSDKNDNETTKPSTKPSDSNTNNQGNTIDNSSNEQTTIVNNNQNSKKKNDNNTLQIVVIIVTMLIVLVISEMYIKKDN